MKLVTMSRVQIEAEMPKITTGMPAAAICIAYPNGRLHRVRRQGQLWRVHHTRFSDRSGTGEWNYPEGKGTDGEPIPMTRGQAIDILDFVRDLPPEIESLYIACFGGAGRSAGIALGLFDMHSDWDDVWINREGRPNAWCRLMLHRNATTT